MTPLHIYSTAIALLSCLLLVPLAGSAEYFDGMAVTTSVPLIMQDACGQRIPSGTAARVVKALPNAHVLLVYDGRSVREVTVPIGTIDRHRLRPIQQRLSSKVKVASRGNAILCLECLTLLPQAAAVLSAHDDIDKQKIEMQADELFRNHFASSSPSDQATLLRCLTGSTDEATLKLRESTALLSMQQASDADLYESAAQWLLNYSPDKSVLYNQIILDVGDTNRAHLTSAIVPWFYTTEHTEWFEMLLRAAGEAPGMRRVTYLLLAKTGLSQVHLFDLHLSDAAFTPIGHCFEDDNVSVQLLAAECASFAGNGGQSLLGPLLKCFEDAKRARDHLLAVASAVAVLVSEPAHDGAATFILTSLQSENDVVRRLTVEALLDSRVTRDWLLSEQKQLRSLWQSGVPGKLSALELNVAPNNASLGDEELSFIGLMDTNPTVQIAAISGQRLELSPDQEDAVVPHLSKGAVKALLRSIGVKNPSLSQRLRADVDPSVREAAATFAAIKGDELLASLSKEKDDGVRRALLFRLASSLMGPYDGASTLAKESVLQQALATGDGAVHFAILDGLTHVGPFSQREQASPTERLSSLAAITRLLSKASTHRSAAVRLHALGVYLFYDEYALLPLSNHIVDSDKSVRMEAARILSILIRRKTAGLISPERQVVSSGAVKTASHALLVALARATDDDERTAMLEASCALSPFAPWLPSSAMRYESKRGRLPHDTIHIEEAEAISVAPIVDEIRRDLLSGQGLRASKKLEQLERFEFQNGGESLLMPLLDLPVRDEEQIAQILRIVKAILSGFGGFAAPAFGEVWPPPPWTVVELLRAAEYGSTYGDAYSVIVGALGKCGYTDTVLFQANDGFAVMTRIERLGENGRSMEEGRWDIEKRSLHLGLRSFLTALLFAPDGEYRAFIIAVTDQELDRPGRTSLAQMSDEVRGSNQLMPSIAVRELREANCYILTYVLTRSADGRLTTESKDMHSLTGRQHAEQSGILPSMESLRTLRDQPR